MHGRNKEFRVRPVAERANLSAAAIPNSVPKFGEKNVEAHGVTVQPPKRSWVSFAVPVIRILSACPLVCLSMPVVLNTQTMIVEMARARDSAPTHAGEQLRDFQGQAPEFEGIVAGAMEMPQVRLIFCAAHRRKQGHQDEQRSAAPNTRLGAEDIPENTRPGPAARWKAVDHLRLLRLLIGIL